MDKKILLSFLIFFAILKISFSTDTLIVNETDLVNLVPKAYDPDNNNLAYSFSPPLDGDGKWQTDYGDAGQYNITITVSDEQSSTTKNVLLVVNKKEEPPTIDSYEPDAYGLYFDEGKRIDFSVSASDLNNDKLSYAWELDGKPIGEGSSYTYLIDYEQAGKHSVKAYVSDGRSVASQEWSVNVNNVDRSRILEQINDVEVKETAIVSLNLPDFSAYNLQYEISEPIGNDNRWETTYDDAGEYKVKITIKDKNFEGSREISVRVNNVDRKPELEPVSGIIFISENQKLTISLNATDPDGDEITHSAENLPEGASLNGNVFTWHPGYDTIKREGWFNLLLDKYHLLSKSYRIKFVAKSNEFKDEKSATIIVKDVNRKPELEPIDDIVVNESNSFTISAKAMDPDGDKISYSYSGWVNQENYITRHGDAGAHKATVTVSDGWLSDSKDVNIIVKKVNKAPILKPIGKKRVSENESIEIELKASDPDNDKLTFYSSNLTGSSIIGNIFRWKPSFDFVKEGDEAYTTLVFVVSDGSLEAEQDATIFVDNVNRQPKIIKTNPAKGVTVNANSPLVFGVEAIDPDGDSLEYKWDFGLFDKYEGRDKIKRIFTTKGDKKVKVTVSDGTEDNSYEWDVKVV